jgi:galactonate dehydratase
VSTPNHVIQEEMVGAVPWYFDVVQGPIRMVDGFWQVPTAPGLGIEVNEAECQRHPFQPEVLQTRNAILDDGSIADW